MRIAHPLLCMILVTAALADEHPLIQPGAEVKMLAEGFVFTEGPACDAAGNVYFSDVRDSKTYVWSTKGKLSIFRENTGEANGLYFDKDGNLICCEVAGRRLTKVSPDRTATTIVDRYHEKRFNSPNDLWIDPKGGIYFTDPRYRNLDGLEQDGFHVYYVPAKRDRSDGEPVRRVIDNLVKPNGIVGTRDGKILYVADHGDSKTYSYKIAADGSLDDRKLIAPQGSDGMTLDEQGNLYLTADDVDVFRPTGEKLATIQVPGRASNVCFGGAARDTLFITANNRLYSVKLKLRGM